MVKFFLCFGKVKVSYLVSMQREDLQRVMDLLSVREHHARTLLIHFRWNVEKLFDVYVEKGKACMFAEAGIIVVELVDLDPEESTSMMMCNICMDDTPAKDMTLMDCGHCFCNNCKHRFLPADHVSRFYAGTLKMSSITVAGSVIHLYDIL